MHALGDFFQRCRALGSESQIDARDVRRRHAKGHTSQLAFDRRQAKRDSFRCASRTWNDVHVSVSTTAPIFLTRTILSWLRGGDGMDCRHQSFFKSTGIQNDFDHWRKAIRGARCVGNDSVLLWVVCRVIHFINKRWNFFLALGRRRNQHASASRIEMLLCIFRGREKTSGLDHIINSHRLPRQQRRIFDRSALGSMSTVDNLFAFGMNVFPKASVHRVISQQVCKVVRRNKIVHRNNFNIAAMRCDSIDQTTDATKSVYCDSNCHVSPMK